MLSLTDPLIDSVYFNSSFPIQASMHDPDLTALRVFCQIVEAGSFTAAADRLGMAPPMVSKQLARLERDLETRLLNRSSRSMSLTEAGGLFHAQALLALEALDAGLALVGQARAQPRGELKVSAPVWMANARFAALLAEYRRQCPEVRLDVYLENRMVDIVAEGFDLALRMNNDGAQDVVSRRVCAVSFHCVATPDYLRQCRGETAAAALPAMIVPNLMQFGRLKMPAARMGLAPSQPVAMKSSDATLSYHAVMAGMGAAFLPDAMVADDLAQGRLVHVHAHATGEAFTGQLFAVYPSRRHLPPKLRSFVDFLLARLGQSAP